MSWDCLHVLSTGVSLIPQCAADTKNSFHKKNMEGKEWQTLARNYVLCSIEKNNLIFGTNRKSDHNNTSYCYSYDSWKSEPSFLNGGDGLQQSMETVCLWLLPITLSPWELHTPAGRTQGKHSGTGQDQSCNHSVFARHLVHYHST